jgi:hypothetical protein
MKKISVIILAMLMGGCVSLSRNEGPSNYIQTEKLLSENNKLRNQLIDQLEFIDMVEKRTAKIKNETVKLRKENLKLLNFIKAMQNNSGNGGK